MLKTIHPWTSLPKRAYTVLPRWQAVVWRRKPSGRPAEPAQTGPGPQPRWV